MCVRLMCLCVECEMKLGRAMCACRRKNESMGMKKEAVE